MQISMPIRKIVAPAFLAATISSVCLQGESAWQPVAPMGINLSAAPRSLPDSNPFAPGTILVADLGESASGSAGAVLAIDPVTGTQQVVSIGGVFGAAVAVAIEADGGIVAGVNVPGTIVRVNPHNGQQTILSSGNNLTVVADLAVAPNGDIFVADQQSGGGALIRIDPISGQQTVIQSGLGPPGLGGPTGVDVARDGTVLIAVPRLSGPTGPGAVYRIDPNSHQTIQQFVGGLLTFPSDVAVSASGQLYVTNPDGQFGTGSIVRIDPATGFQAVVSAGGLLVDPNRLTVDVSGDLIVGDPNGRGASDPPTVQTGTILRIDPNNGAQTIVSSGGFFVDPNGVAVMRHSTSPPAITSLTATPNVLWPPNQKMVGVSLAVAVSDRSDPAPVCQISSVTSNEPRTRDALDWAITGPLAVNLRSDRAGNGAGRVYTITVTCTNADHLSASKTVTANVPHDQRQ